MGAACGALAGTAGALRGAGAAPIVAVDPDEVDPELDVDGSSSIGLQPVSASSAAASRAGGKIFIGRL
jgi:hypothetical protein